MGFLWEKYQPLFQIKNNKKIVGKNTKTNNYLLKKILLCSKPSKKLYGKGVKPRNYTFSNKIWLNYKYIKGKQKNKLKAKLFGIFQVVYQVKK